ncbi:MAG: hypothetical protein NTV54_16295 [Ignavibacteriales bacterium]|nr:hypothetical protein [Ignavibacteriales bacterium]
MFRWLTFVLSLVVFVVMTGVAQDKRTEEDKDDTFEETSSNQLTLRFYNALTGIPIPNAAVDLKEKGKYTTDVEGKIRFPAPEEDAEYQFAFSAPGYVTSDLTFEVMAGTIFQKRYSISPAIDLKFLRVVLDWGAEPLDLDAHFVKDGAYHISYRNMRSMVDGSALLDRDARQGYGPETITVKEVSKQASYQYYVHDFSHQRSNDSRALSKARAVIKVFGEGRVLKTFHIPEGGIGTVWEVFRITNGQIVETNMLRNE